jgi:AbiJ-like protein/abortive infection Abi-like protein
VPRLPRTTPTTITEITRRDIFDAITVEGIAWFGRLSEPAFLERVWDLNDMPSTDRRLPNAARDIWQHRINNPQDWEDDWIFTDSRFDLMHGDDETFLRFLSEMVHPAMRPNPDEAQQLARLFNEKLAGDGWVLVATKEMSGKPVFEGRRRKGAKHPTTAPRLPEYQRLRDPQVLQEHMRRIDAGLASDPAAAIASSKELVESVCKVILDDYDLVYDRRDDLLDLYKAAAKVLKLSAESVPDSAKGSQAAQGALRALVTTVQRLAELRNELGLGHGRSRASQALTRHARLAFNSASAVAELLLDTWHERPGDASDTTSAVGASRR